MTQWFNSLPNRCFPFSSYFVAAHTYLNDWPRNCVSRICKRACRTNLHKTHTVFSYNYFFSKANGNVCKCDCKAVRGEKKNNKKCGKKSKANSRYSRNSSTSDCARRAKQCWHTAFNCGTASTANNYTHTLVHKCL